MSVVLRHPDDAGTETSMTRSADFFPDHRTTLGDSAALLLRGDDVQLQGAIE